MGQQLKRNGYYDRILVPEPRLKSVSNSSTRLSDALFWLLGTRHTYGTHTHMQVLLVSFWL